MTMPRDVRLFRNGRNQAERIPSDSELDGDEAILRREGDRLIPESAPQTSLSDLLRTLKPITEPFPDIDTGLPPLDDVRL